MLNQLIAFRRWLSPPAPRKRKAGKSHLPSYQQLEPRVVLSITAGNASYTASSAATRRRE